MPRSGGGTYTLPESAFVAGTVIQSSPMNSDLNDIATALTQSLATTGVSTMTGPIKAASGSVTAPSYTFGTSTGTGWYLSSADAIAWTAAGALAATFGATGNVVWQGAASWVGALTMQGDPVTNFPSGTVMLFSQTAAPTNWTKGVAFDDYSLRVTSGTVGTGGSVNFSTLFARTATDTHVLLEAELAAHAHSASNDQATAAAGGATVVQPITPSSGAFSWNTTSKGSDTAHSHNIDMRVKYVDTILATRD